MTRIKNCPVELQELIQWLVAWKSNRELAFSAMPHELYAYLRQEEILDEHWDVNDHKATALTTSLAPYGDTVVRITEC